MLKRVHGFPRVGMAVVLMALALAACNDEKRNTSSADAGVPAASNNGPVLGGKLGEAVKGATAAQPVQKEDKPDGAPPETGVFTPAAADAAHAPNTPPKLQLFSEGNGPKLPLAYTLAPGTERKTSLIFQVQGVQGAPPALTLALVFSSEKPKDDKKANKDKAKDDKDKDKVNPDQPTGLPVTLKIAEAKPLRGGSLDGDLENLKDVVIRYRLTPAGIPSDVAIEYPKKSNEAIEIIATSLIDALLCMTVPVPEKPVGVGAYWMVSERLRSSGVDVVRFRAAKVEKIDDKTASLSITIRQYAANTNIALPGLPKEIQVSVDQYESQGKSEISLGPDAFLPGKGQLAVVMQAALGLPNQQQQPQGRRPAVRTDIQLALGQTP